MTSTPKRPTPPRTPNLLSAPYSAGDLNGWHVDEESDDAVDDRQLVRPDGSLVVTWREGRDAAFDMLHYRVRHLVWRRCSGQPIGADGPTESLLG